MKKFKADATTIVEELPEGVDLLIHIEGPGNVVLKINKDSIFQVLASLDVILATINSRGKQMIQQYLVRQATKENQIVTARRKQEKQGLVGDGIDKGIDIGTKRRRDQR